MDTSLCCTVLLVLIVPILSVPDGSPCPKPSGETSTCVCQTSKGVVDLRSAASDNGVPRYKGLEDPNNFFYEYNPCYPFSAVGGECVNVHICQFSKDLSPSTYKVADAGTEQMYLDNNGTEPKVGIFYTSSDRFGTYREVNVQLQCDQNVEEPIVNTTGDNIHIFTYEITFRSCHACPGGCNGQETVRSSHMIVLVTLIASVMVNCLMA